MTEQSVSGNEKRKNQPVRRIAREESEADVASFDKGRQPLPRAIPSMLHSPSGNHA